MTGRHQDRELQRPEIPDEYRGYAVAFVVIAGVVILGVLVFAGWMIYLVVTHYISGH